MASLTNNVNAAEEFKFPLNDIMSKAVDFADNQDWLFDIHPDWDDFLYSIEFVEKDEEEEPAPPVPVPVPGSLKLDEDKRSKKSNDGVVVGGGVEETKSAVTGKKRKLAVREVTRKPKTAENVQASKDKVKIAKSSGIVDPTKEVANTVNLPVDPDPVPVDSSDSSEPLSAAIIAGKATPKSDFSQDPVLGQIMLSEDDFVDPLSPSMKDRLKIGTAKYRSMKSKGVLATVPAHLLTFFYDLMNSFNGCDLVELERVINRSVSSDVVLRTVTPAMNNTLHGREHVVNLYKSLLAAYPDAVAVERDIKLLFEDGRLVLFSRFFYTGTKAFVLPSNAYFTNTGNVADIMDKQDLSPEQIASLEKFESVLRSNGTLILVHAVGYKKLYINPDAMEVETFYVNWQVTNFRPEPVPSNSS